MIFCLEEHLLKMCGGVWIYHAASECCTHVCSDKYRVVPGITCVQLFMWVKFVLLVSVFVLYSGRARSAPPRG